MKRPTYDEEKQMIADAIAQLPEEFGLRAFPGKRFRPIPTSSYYSESRQAVLVYIGIVQDGVAYDFDKDTVAAIKREMVTTNRGGK